VASKIIDLIDSPADIRKLPVEKLPLLADEIRDLMIESVSHTGGHLAPSLGTVELTIALHYCFNTPEDKLVWDVGHQAYAHKILTGRKDRFKQLRQFGGISGFPRISESQYDAISVGHASTSISGALGLAVGRDILKQNHSIVAIIGDGALGGGLALEGLNNLGSSSTNMTIVLNDNEMSISKNVGALSRYLTRVITDKRYNKIKAEIWDLLGNTNVGKSIRSIVKGIDDALKHIVIPGKLFEDMGLRYIGPVDGHNVSEMIEVLRSVQTLSSPRLVHVLTKKGKGYSFAENDSTKFHGIGGFSRSTGESIKSSSAPSYSEVFGNSLVEFAKENTKIIAITAAMRDGTKLNEFSRIYPDRFFDVGIAESHAVTFAAGLALKGLTPVVALYSTFLQRAYDQIMHDVALDNLHVVFCVDRAGLVGDDGPTHHGMFDLSFLRTVPGAVIMAPRDESELRNMLFTAVNQINGPVFIRYPRGCGTGVKIPESPRVIEICEPEIIKTGSELALVSIGDFFGIAEKTCASLASKGIDATFVDAKFAKPLDRKFYRALFTNHKYIAVFENNSITGGFGSGLIELAQELDLDKPPRILRFGLPDMFVGHGDLEHLHKEAGLDSETVLSRIITMLNRTPSTANVKAF
jgi:1-deoxy-D-xylulose-5-phosphate synthase